MTKCGTVTVLGAPNVGKSTLINAWVGSKVSIVSPKVQTTRALVRGIALYEDAQIIFIDTPGIFKPKQRLEKAMVRAAWQGEAEAEIIALVVDAERKKIGEDTARIVSKLGDSNENRLHILILNKVDKCNKKQLLSLAEELNELFDFDATFMVSALKEDRLDDVLSYIKDKLPESPWLYPEDQVSDMPMRLLAAEITREKCFQRLHQELPYALTVETEDWEEFENGSVKISQVIFIARDNHKGIVLGKHGSNIKEIGERSRLELEEIMGGRVHLKLFVKVQENWLDDPEKYLIWGLDHAV